MDQLKDAVPIVAALAGVVIGALLNFFVMRYSKSQDWKYVLAKERSALRLKIYAEFLVESQRIVFVSIGEKSFDLNELTAMNGKYAELQLLATEDVVSCAQRMANCAVDSHAEKSLIDRASFPALRVEFIGAVRAELAAIEKVK